MPPVHLLTVTLNAAIDKRYLVERLEVPGVNRVRSCSATAGGKGLNVARTARIGGAVVTATGFLGGHAGEFIAAHLGDAGVADRFVRVPGESRTCINVLDEASETVTELLEPGDPVREKDVAALLAALPALLRGADVITLSGSLPLGCPPDIYARIIDLAHAHGVPSVLDSSGEALRLGVAARPTVVKPNAAEAADLMGWPDAAGLPPGDLALAGRRLLEAGVGGVVFSLGPDGAVMVGADGVWHARPPRLTPVNTVGCGDAMVAALAEGLALRLEPQRLLGKAVAISAAAALCARTGEYVEADAARLRPLVECESLAD